MALSDSSLPSQTPREHEELLKYEYNLASCYEAEYLLSMKLQEDMMRSRSSTGGSSCSTSREQYYDDIYETQQPTGSTADHSLPSRHSVPSSAVFGGGDFESMETTTSYNEHLSMNNETDTSTAAPLQYSCANVSLVRAPDMCKNRVVGSGQFVNGSHQSIMNAGYGSNGYTIMEDGTNWSSHIEGPARKKVRMQQQPDY